MTLAEAKKSLRLSGTANDDELLSLIEAATEHLQQRIDRALITQSFEWSSDHFPSGAIMLPHEPIASITEITYDDQEGNPQTLDPALYALNPGNRQVYRVSDESWPATSKRQRSARVVYVAGYGDAAAVPRIFKRIILQIAGRLFFDPAAERSETSQFLEQLTAGYVRTGYE